MSLQRQSVFAWIFLTLAIFAEVIATGVLKVGKGSLYSYIFMAIFIAISYYLMALAIRKIQVGIAYAMWEILGSSCIVLMSVFIFDEVLSVKQTIGILLAIVGIILINIGEVKEK